MHHDNMKNDSNTKKNEEIKKVLVKAINSNKFVPIKDVEAGSCYTTDNACRAFYAVISPTCPTYL